MASRKPLQARLRTPDANIVLYGCRPYEPRYDLASMGVQDEATGLWHAGRQRRRRRCGKCGGDPARNAYCESCAAAGDRFRAPWTLPMPDPDPKDRPAPPSGKPAEKLTRKERRRLKAQQLARSA